MFTLKKARILVILRIVPPSPDVIAREKPWKRQLTISKMQFVDASKPLKPLALSIPDHKVLDRGLLRSLIRDAGMSVQDFLNLL
jgi:hypothetical protein